MVIFLLVFLVGILGLYWYSTSRPALKTTSTTKGEIPVVTNVVNATNSTATNTTSSNTTVTNSTNTTPTQSGGKSSSSGNITLSTPKSGDVLTQTFTVSGYARVFENVVNIRVKDDAGKVLYSDFATANSPDVGKTGPFSKSITLKTLPASKKGKVEVYDISAANGKEIDLISVAVTFK